MGFFDDWKEKENSDYILTTEYVEQLARKHDSSIKATAEYLLHIGFGATLYFKEPNGDFKRDETYNYEDHGVDEGPYIFLTHIIYNIDEYKDTSFQTNASHLALRYADRYFYKIDLPSIRTDKINPVISEQNAELIQQLADEKKKVAQLIAEKEQAQSTGSFSMGSPTVAYDKPETIEQFREALKAANVKIDDLMSQLAQAKVELIDISANNQKTENQGDSLLILGAVMHCIKDAAKRNFTQDLLTQTILDKYKNVSGLSKSTLDKKYSEAKTYIKQRHTS